MKYHRHLIKNHAPNAPLWQRVANNIIFSVGVTKIRRRDNLLTGDEFLEVRELVKPGDTILVGSLRRLASVMIRGPVTHALLCQTSKWYIHSISDGVERIRLQDIFEEYDTLTIVRPKKIDGRSKKIKKVIRYAKQQIGKPFDFYLQPGNNTFYCTQLIAHAYAHGNIPTGIPLFNGDADSIAKKIKALQYAPHPMHFVNEDFDVVYLSSRLALNDNNKLTFVGPNPWL